ncbi:MAG: heme transporter permease, partial [Paucimonas sp.]|nr:heme transporter permease [Paucimonas sp.]
MSATNDTLSGRPPLSASVWFKYASPQTFFPLAGKLIPVFAVIGTLLCIIGMYIGFFVAPTDHQQGEAYRIIFLHVP